MIRWNIAWRMGLGFGIFILAVAVLFVFTRATLTQSSELAEEVDESLVPSLEALEDMDQTLAESRVYISHWLTRQSRADDEEKRALRRLVKESFPQHIVALQSLEGAWSPAARAHLDTLRVETDALGLLYGEIMRLLPDFRSYDNPIAYMQAQDYAMEGAELQTYTARVKSRLARLTATQNAALRSRTARMEELGAQLTMYAGRVAWVVVILGIALGVIVTRSIVQPMKELKRALLHMGRGVLPDRKVRVTSDEIGDMALAVNRLAEGLARTQRFSQEVGGGDFDTPYEPLSDDDALGKALLQMRSSLAANERELEGKVEERTEELAQQKARAEEILSDLQDSISYALRIQQAILPSEQERKEVIYDSAVFYQPRDVVSGDFYWFKSVGSRRMFAAIDCTGHGVPGAFLSLVGHNALDRVTKVYTEPHKVLDKLNEHVLMLLRQDIRTEASIPAELLRDLALPVEQLPSTYMGGQDGMDLAMVAINWEHMTVEFAGANNPLFLVRNGELQEYKSDKFAICSFEPGAKNYEVQKLDVQSGDTLFLATDGFVDQFGGPRGKKFMRRRFRELLVETASLPVSEHEAHLRAKFEDWRGDEEQVDDVLVVSMRVP
ncbi:SpoIIE family protein phosphatase [Flavobacteriales bacterium]|nr:SpoIIE family protein phosphatase [Flavobacteriales bacterium]